VNQLRQPIADGDEAGRHPERTRIVDDAEIERLEFPSTGLNDRDAGVAQGGIDGQDAHGHEKVTANRRIAELKFRPARFKTEVDKEREFEFILDRGGESKAAVPGLS
jgi:hypothetical protein